MRSLFALWAASVSAGVLVPTDTGRGTKRERERERETEDERAKEMLELQIWSLYVFGGSSMNASSSKTMLLAPEEHHICPPFPSVQALIFFLER
jgi:hypothetical protein